MKGLLSTQNLCCQFGGVMATNDVCFSVEHNGLTSIIGPNGAGKTTFINLVTGKIGASSGKILFKERDITNTPTHELVKMGISRTFQINSLFENLSVFENLRIARQAKVGGSFRIFSLKQKLKPVIKDTWAILERLGLEKLADLPAKNLAYGDQRILEVAIALAGDPKILFLDEPTAGMSPFGNPSYCRLDRRSGQRHQHCPGGARYGYGHADFRPDHGSPGRLHHLRRYAPGNSQ